MGKQFAVNKGYKHYDFVCTHTSIVKSIEVVPVVLEETELTAELGLALNRVQALHHVHDTSYQQHLRHVQG